MKNLYDLCCDYIDHCNISDITANEGIYDACFAIIDGVNTDKQYKMLTNFFNLK